VSAVIQRISQILAPLYSDPGIRMIVLYRIDGEPIFTKMNGPRHELVSILYWLENQIREMLCYIFNRNLSEANFRFGDMRIYMYPVSRTLVLSIMTGEEASMYKLEVDIKTACMELGRLVGYEG
jgi:predicted regulator of Ras-like GTPase activity (Roadblock/LC7/MglB family)